MMKDDYAKQEKVNGLTYSLMPMADYRHGTVNLNIQRKIGNQLKNTSCMVFAENLDWRFDEYGTEYVIPDVMIINDRKYLNKGQYTGVPKFIVETLSPSTALKDKTVKKELYARKGVDEYWIVDSKAHNIEVYYLEGEGYRLVEVYILENDTEDEDYNAQTEITLRAFPEIKMTLAEIFENAD